MMMGTLVGLRPNEKEIAGKYANVRKSPKFFVSELGYTLLSGIVWKTMFGFPF